MSAAMLCPYCHDDDFKGSSDLISLSLENDRDAGAVVYITPEEQIMEPSDEPEPATLVLEDEIGYSAVVINYCPICGRDLRV